jgi:LemA protein
MWNFITGIFSLVFWLGVPLLIFAAWTYNKLQRQAQEVREAMSNVSVVVSKKLNLLNSLIDVVKSYQEGEQFTHLKVSQDNTAVAVAAAIQQSGSMLTALQGMAERFPNLKSSEQYHRLIDSIQHCELDLQRSREGYNAAAKHYNNVYLAFPTVLIGRFIGFSKAPYLEFDHAGNIDQAQLKSFQTDDGERLQQLLSNAGGHLAGATRALAGQAGQAGKLLAGQAGQAGKMIAAKVAERNNVTYFYLPKGGVPRGPVPLPTVHELIQRGELEADVLVARAGSEEWQTVSAIRTEV